MKMVVYLVVYHMSVFTHVCVGSALPGTVWCKSTRAISLSITDAQKCYHVVDNDFWVKCLILR